MLIIVYFSSKIATNIHTVVTKSDILNIEKSFLPLKYNRTNSVLT